MRPGVPHRTFQPDGAGQPGHPPAARIQRHDLVGDVAESLLHQLDRRGALALVGPATQDDDAVAAGDGCGVGQQRGARPEHRDRGDRREHVGHRVMERPAVAEQLAILGDDEPVVVPDVETVDRRVARGGMGRQQRGERVGHPLVVAGDLERLTDGVEAPHGDRIARWRARRWPRRKRLAVVLVRRPCRRPRRRTGASRRRPSTVARRTCRPARPRRRRTPRTGSRDGRRTHRANRRRASLPTADRRSPWRRRHRPPRTTVAAAASSPAKGTVSLPCHTTFEVRVEHPPSSLGTRRRRTPTHDQAGRSLFARSAPLTFRGRRAIGWRSEQCRAT